VSGAEDAALHARTQQQQHGLRHTCRQGHINSRRGSSRGMLPAIFAADLCVLCMPHCQALVVAAVALSLQLTHGPLNDITYGIMSMSIVTCTFYQNPPICCNSVCVI
jgi:hypothetical protein